VNWDQLVQGVELPFHPDLKVPALSEVRLAMPNPEPIADVEVAAREGVIARLAGHVTPGMTVAVGGGSRGLTDRVALLRGTLAGLRALGAQPFVVPAMGSHGGAKAEGQLAMLASLGMTEETLGAEIRATMETVEVARTAEGMPLYLDRHAAGADRILPVNRIKPHTCFRGPLQSGVSKMAVVGFGKQPGAAQFHARGPIEMRNRIIDGIAALKATGRILGGVASIESAAGHVVKVATLTADEVGSQTEIDLTIESAELVPPLPFAEIDVLIVNKGGKDISGTTMDPNVTGRFWVHGLDDFAQPDVRAIVMLDLTDISAGNALGIGTADFIPAALANKVDWQKTYVNTFTSAIAGLQRSKMPMVLPDEEACIKAALSMCGREYDEPAKVVRIESTLHLTRCWVSDALLGELPPGAEIVA